MSKSLEFNTDKDYINNNIKIHSGIKCSTALNVGVTFVDNKCPICLNKMTIHTEKSFDTNYPIMYECNNCGFCSPIIIDDISNMNDIKSDDGKEIKSFLKVFGSDDKFNKLKDLADARYAKDGNFKWQL